MGTERGSNHQLPEIMTSVEATRRRGSGGYGSFCQCWTRWNRTEPK